jgi:hypothetical protein
MKANFIPEASIPRPPAPRIGCCYRLLIARHQSTLDSRVLILAC